MQKIVTNKCYGGFGLSPKAMKRLAELRGIEIHAFTYDENDFNRYVEIDIDNCENVSFISYSTQPLDSERKIVAGSHFHTHVIDRDNPLLIQVVEELGAEASGPYAQLEITEVPDDVDWQIEEYDGNEWISEKHRTW